MASLAEAEVHMGHLVTVFYIQILVMTFWKMLSFRSSSSTEYFQTVCKAQRVWLTWLQHLTPNLPEGNIYFRYGSTGGSVFESCLV